MNDQASFARLLGAAGEMPVEQADAGEGERKQYQPRDGALLQRGKLFGSKNMVAGQYHSATTRTTASGCAVPRAGCVARRTAWHGWNRVVGWQVVA